MIQPNQSPVDVYTGLHFGYGMLLRSLGAGPGLALVSSLVFEYVLEPKYKDLYPELFPAPSQDSRVNSALDTVAVMGGWYLADRMGR